MSPANECVIFVPHFFKFQNVRRSYLAYLNVPLPIAQIVQAELVGEFSSVHGIGQILFVGEHEQNGVAQFVLL